MVSGASGIVGYGILRSLKKSGKELRLIGTTIYDDSVAHAFSDIFELAPLTSDAGYIDWLLNIVIKHKIDLLIPGIEPDMYKWVDYIPEFRDNGIALLLNNTELVSICRDKWKFFEYLRDFNLTYTIDTSLQNDFESLIEKFGLPFLLKPRRGFGSKGIVIDIQC